jgi:hypothetical protein
MSDKLREDFEIATEQKPIKLSGQIPVNYAVGDIRYVEWLEDKLNNTCHEPKHETVEEVCNKLLSLQTVVTILPNYIGNKPYSKAVIFPEQIKLEYDRFTANHHGKPEEI